MVTAHEPETGGLTLQCSECGAELVFEARARTTICPYCRCPSVLERPASRQRPNPVFTLPFTVTADRAQEAVRRWANRLRLIRKSLGAATIAEIKGVYVPAYLYSAIVRAEYSAEIGENYTVTETYTTTVNGKRVTRTRTKTVTEWRSLTGEHQAYATDLLVTASKGLPNAELEAIEPFDMRALRRYAPALVSGWIVEEPSHGREECLGMARQEAVVQEGQRLSAFMPGDKHRNLHYSTTVRDESIDLLLVPVWVLALRPSPDKPAVRVLANGQTAEVWGVEKISWIKIALWVLLVAGLVAVWFFFLRQPVT